MRRIIQIMLATAFSLALNCCESDRSIVFPPDLSASDTIRVPAHVPTLQAAIDAADSAKTILVADGLYIGEGNRDLEFSGKAIVLRSENGPAGTIIDCRADSADPHGGVVFYRGDDEVVIDGFTFRGGYSAHGAGILVTSSSPTVRNCVFVDNHATVSGGAVRCKSASPRFENCTFVGNVSDMVGGALHVIAGSCPAFENCIIAFSEGGAAVYSSDGTSIPDFSCCNIFGNTGGDWVDIIADQAGTDGNFSQDPLFCDTAAGDFHLQPASPCAPDNNSCDTLIGALPAGCLK